jgi:YHS domain-containing protein
VSIPKKTHQYHYDYEGKTAYFSPKKNKERLLFYHDKPSRTVDGKLCLHIEYRLQALNLLKEKNIYTIHDLMDFNHSKLWNQLLDFRKVNLTELGRICSGDDTSRQADHKRGKKEWELIKSLQKYLSHHPERESAFTKITPANLEPHLGKFMNNES